MLVFTVWGFCPLVKADAVAFAGMYVTDPVMVAIKNILNVGVVIVLIQSIKWANSEFTSVRRGEFYELILLTLLGMYFMISSRHFLMFIIGLETASLPLCALVAFDKNRYESHEAAIKYVLTAVFSSAILLMGLSYVYGLTGSLYYADIALFCRANMGVMMIVALAFVIAGFGFKISLVPFHLWTADVYQGRTHLGDLLSLGHLQGFGRLCLPCCAHTGVWHTLPDAWEWMLYALIILTITVGNLFAMRQVNMKRFLAFSSISQAGYIMLAVIGNNAMGVSALMFYVLVYVFSNLAAFGVIGAIENASGKLLMTDYNGLYKTNPRLAFTMMLAMFSLAGIPRLPDSSASSLCSPQLLTAPSQ